MSDTEENQRKRLCLEDKSEQPINSLKTGPAESLLSIDIGASASVPFVNVSDTSESLTVDECGDRQVMEESDVGLESQKEETTGEKLVEEMQKHDKRGQKRKLENVGDDEKVGDEDSAAGATLEDMALLDKEEMKVLVEEDVGITEFISDLAGFSGTIKQRYSDFIVNEISNEGEVVSLTDLSLPAAANTNEDVPQTNNMKELLSEENILKLQTLTQTRNLKDEVLIPVGLDKQLRGQLHQVIKVNFPDLDSNTIDRNGEKYIQIRYRTRKDSRKQNMWKKSKGEYCKFVLYKENKDTLEAVNIIAKFLRVPPNNFSFAGTKDRRAKTSQNVTVYRIEPSRLHHLNSCLRNITLGNFSFCKDPLKLGDLKGNRFTILLRNILGSDEAINDGLTSLRDHGFINYYGMQRFGTTRIPTHHIGQALLCGKWLQAVELIMKPREGDREEISKARSVWWSTRDAEKALKELKNHQCMERKLLEGLKKHAKNDLVSALSWIPVNMRLMYIHAYQSYLWNRVVSRRIRQFGARPIVGDLVLRDHVTEESIEGEEVNTAVSEKNKKTQRPEPVEVTEANLTDFNITDVVLPLPGYDVRYPTHEIKSWYEELLKEDGMAENFTFKSRVRDYSLPGGYRKIVVQPSHVDWDIMYYNDYQVSLIHGDMDKINNEQLPSKLSEGKFKAVKLELTLPSSSYATMALREVLKSGTSAAYHTTLNVT